METWTNSVARIEIPRKYLDLLTDELFEVIQKDCSTRSQPRAAESTWSILTLTVPATALGLTGLKDVVAKALAPIIADFEDDADAAYATFYEEFGYGKE